MVTFRDGPDLKDQESYLQICDSELIAGSARQFVKESVVTMLQPILFLQSFIMC